MKRRKITYILSVVMIAITLSLNAQKPPDPPKPPPPHPELPIDAGLSFLLVAGFALGVYELKIKK